MSPYRVEIARRAVKVLAALPRREQQRVRAAIDLLATTPRPPGCVAMVGEDHAYRVRVGDYRIIYEVFDDRLVVQSYASAIAATSTANSPGLRRGG